MESKVFRPGFGAATTWRAFGAFHRVPNEIACAGLNGQLSRYSGKRWTAFLLYEDGRGVCMSSDPDAPALTPDLWNHLRGWAEGLNRTLADEGHWVVAWDHGAGEARLLFRDEDGDLQALVEIDEGMPKILGWTVMDALNQAAAALHIRKDKLRELGADRPTVRLARGERPH